MVSANVLEKPHVMGMREFARPEVRAGDGILKVELVGICATDVKMYEGKLPERSTYPIILGHEIVGVIDEVGPEAARRWNVKAGDRVVVDSFLGCGTCYQCLSGNNRFCAQSKSYGTRISCDDPPHLWGAYAHYMYLAPNAQVYKVSDAVRPEDGVLICAVLANGVRWVGETGITLGSSLVIQGPGSQGLAGVIAAKEMGAYPIIVTGLAKDKSRLDLALEYGANYAVLVDEEDAIARVKDITGGQMADAVLDVTGSAAAIETSLQLVRRMGTVVLGGLTGGRTIPLAVDKVVFNEIKVRGVLAHDVVSVAQAIKLAEQRKYPLDKMVTHKFTLARAEEAIQLTGDTTGSAGAIKVALDPWA